MHRLWPAESPRTGHSAESMRDDLRSFPDRDEVKCAIMDMYRGFRDGARTFFPHAKIIIDRFHVVRFCT